MNFNSNTPWTDICYTDEGWLGDEQAELKTDALELEEYSLLNKLGLFVDSFQM